MCHMMIATSKLFSSEYVQSIRLFPLVGSMSGSAACINSKMSNYVNV